MIALNGLNDGCTYLLPGQPEKQKDCDSKSCDSCHSCSGGENFGNTNRLPININLNIPLSVNNGHYNDVANTREFPMQQQQQVIVPGNSPVVQQPTQPSGQSHPQRPVVIVVPMTGGRREVELPVEIPVPGNGGNGTSTVLQPVRPVDPEFDAWL